MKRSSGIFLHPTSLPSEFGVGDLGSNAYRWVDTLASMKQSYWQVCPLGPTSYGYSPYLTLSSFAGNHLLISLELLYKEGLLSDSDLDSYPTLADDYAEFSKVEVAKLRVLKTAFKNFNSSRREFIDFCNKESWWLNDYALFVAMKKKNNDLPWNEWPADIRLRVGDSVKLACETEKDEMDFQKFLQYLFHTQWSKLKEYANEKGIQIFGDVPYYIALDSSDAWSQPELFDFDENGKPGEVGGVPPDYFSADGQLWGNPVYNWKLMKEDGYRWWINRIRKALSFSDWVRIDHFRAFESYWSIPASEKTAINGEWVEGPGISFFEALKAEFGDVPLIAEDLGVITPEVDKLRIDAGLPGMKVLQFAFDGNEDNPYLPYNICNESVVYTGTHDNNTSIGWYNELDENAKNIIRNYLACSDEDFIWAFLRVALGTNADLSVVPFQDVLALDGAHRFNTPGTGEGNWKWRFDWGMLDLHKLEMFTNYTKIYGRSQ